MHAQFTHDQTYLACSLGGAGAVLGLHKISIIVAVVRVCVRACMYICLRPCLYVCVCVYVYECVVFVFLCV
jgi:hypothetical protein